MRNWRCGWLIALLLLWLCLPLACGGLDDNHSTSPGSPDDDNTSADDDSSNPGGPDDDLYSPPDELGPYAVGVTTIYLTDPSRYELWGLRDRELPLEIWYPSTGAGGRSNTMPDMVGPVPDWALGLLKLAFGKKFDELWGTVTSALRDADVEIHGAPYPVVFFSHGLTAIRFQNFTLCEYLASHGFIVVAPDHYGNAIFTNLPDEGAVIIYDALTLVSGLWDRTNDIDFVYQELTRLDGDSRFPLHELLDLNEFAVSGHSYGGLTALQAGVDIDYLAAIAPLNPFWIGNDYQQFDKPFFLLQSAEDSIVGFTNAASLGAFNSAPSKHKVYIELQNAGHYSATDACLLLPPWFPSSTSGCGGTMIAPAEANRIVGAYLTAFFKVVLAGDDRYADYLEENHFPDEMDLTTVWK
jgi:dienelactone hydrolase